MKLCLERAGRQMSVSGGTWMVIERPIGDTGSTPGLLSQCHLKLDVEAEAEAEPARSHAMLVKSIFVICVREASISW